MMKMNATTAVNVETSVVSAKKMTTLESPEGGSSSEPEERKVPLSVEVSSSKDETEKSSTKSSPAADDPVVESETDAAATKSNGSLDLPSPETEEDEEIRLAMEMAMAAAQNPHLSPAEIQKLVGEKNMQAKMIDEFSKQNEGKIKANQAKVREQQRKALAAEAASNTANNTSSWWTAAAKRAEEMKDRAERHLYADQINKDEAILDLRKRFKILKKTYKAHRLQGNRVETRHVFKRQRMEKKMIAVTDKLRKTQHVFTNSGYNVQEYLKATMRASKKWRKVGSDEELMLEAQLSRNMHQMLALEKQKVKCKKNTKEMKKYLQRCKGWLSDKKAFCEMNLMTLEATQNSMMRLYGETLRRQDRLIAKLKASDEFKSIDLSTVDLSHVTFPEFISTQKDPARSAAFEAMRGLPITDSIKVKKGHLAAAVASASAAVASADTAAASAPTPANAAAASAQASSRKQLVQEYYKQQEQGQGGTDDDMNPPPGAPELYVVASDDVSVSSHLSDPDGDDEHGGLGFHEHDEHDDDDNDSANNFGNDAPWMASARSAGASAGAASRSISGDSTDEDDKHDAAFRNTAMAIGLKPTTSSPPSPNADDTETTEKVVSQSADSTPTVSTSSDEGNKVQSSSE